MLTARMQSSTSSRALERVGMHRAMGCIHEVCTDLGWADVALSGAPRFGFDRYLYAILVPSDGSFFVCFFASLRLSHKKAEYASN